MILEKVILVIKIPLLHNKTDKEDLIKKYYIALIPLIIFSIYKNGILLYTNDLIKLGNILIPIYFYVISIIVAVLISKILKEDLQENILISLIIACTISINTNMIIYPILLFVSLFISKYILNKTKLNFNIISFSRLLLILSLLLNAYSYLNIAEKLNKFNYNYFDIFIGHGLGGIASTSALALIICFIILLTDRYYKKIIPIVSSLTFILIYIVYIILTKNYDCLNIVLNGLNYFSFIFIAPDIYLTPVAKNGMFIYGILIGIFTSILSILGLTYEASFISIFLISLFIPLINKITNKKYLKS